MKGRELILASTAVTTCVSTVAKPGLYFTLTNGSVGAVFDNYVPAVRILHHMGITRLKDASPIVGVASICTHEGLLYHCRLVVRLSKESFITSSFPVAGIEQTVDIYI